MFSFWILFLLNLPSIFSQSYSITIEAEDFMEGIGTIVNLAGTGGSRMSISLDSSSVAAYSVTLPLPGTWYVWVRGNWDANADGIWMTMDGAKANPLDNSGNPTPPANSILIKGLNKDDFQWACCNPSLDFAGIKNSFTVPNKGQVIFRLIARTTGVKIDQIVLRNYDGESPGIPTFTLLGAAACRWLDSNDDSNTFFTAMLNTNRQTCQDTCGQGCYAYEHNPDDKCEHWNRIPKATANADGFSCYIKDMGAEITDGPMVLAEANEIVLVNADTNTDIKFLDLNQPTTIYLSEMPNKIDLRFNFTGQFSSVGFTSNKTIPMDKLDNGAPWTVQEEINGNYVGWEPFPDTYRISGTAWSQADLGGVRGKIQHLELIVRLSLPNSPPTLSPNPQMVNKIVKQTDSFDEQPWLFPLLSTVLILLSLGCAIGSIILFKRQQKITQSLAEKVPVGTIL